MSTRLNMPMLFLSAAANGNLQKRLIFTRGRKVKLHFVNEQVDRNRVIERNSYDRRVGQNLDLVFFDWYVQVHGLFEDALADLLFRIAVYHSKARLFLHFIGELIFSDVRRKQADRTKYPENDNRRVGNRLELPRPTLSAELTLLCVHLEH